MKTLKGSENNSITLTTEDFEKSVIHPYSKIYIYKKGWRQVDENDILDFHIDFKTSGIHGIVSASLDLTLDDTVKKYHPLSGTSYADYFSFRRKIKAYVGIKRDNNGDGITETPYTWSYFSGFVVEVKHGKTAGKRTVTVKALDNCDILNNYKFDNNTYFGSSTIITLSSEVEYSMPANCQGVFKCLLAGEEFDDWIYNFETNKIAITKEGLIGKLTIYYYTQQNVIDVMKSILLQSKAITSVDNFIYQNPNKYINRVWFDEGTSAYEAISLITQLVNYRFWFDGDGMAHFEPVPSEGVSVFSFKETANIESIDVKISDKEFYNGVEIIGEERTRNQYFKKEVTLGTASGSLDASTTSKEHNFTFSNYDKLRYEINAGNKNGLTSELDKTTTGAKISVMHNPEYSREETETKLGTVSGTLGVLDNTEKQTNLTHVPATRIKHVINNTNKYGLTTSLNSKDYWNTEVVVSHDPLRNLSSVVNQNIGSASGYASVSGKEINVSFLSGKLFGNVRHNINYDDGWGAEQLTGSGNWELTAPSVRYVTIPLSSDYQGQHRWEGTKPNTWPSGTIAVKGSKDIPPNSYEWHTVYSRSYVGALSFSASGFVAVSGVEVSNPEIYQTDSYIKISFLVRNPRKYSVTLEYRVFITYPPTYFNIIPLGATESYARFRLEALFNGDFCPREKAYFSIKVYSKRKPYNVKVNQTYQDGTKASFIAKCDFDSPLVTIICQGQEAIPRPYTIDVYGLRLIPRPYYLTLYGREVVPELVSKIYSFKKLTDTEISQTGGPKFLTINNHLIQEQSEADNLAQSLLNHYKNVVNVCSITVSCPPPIEVGDTIEIMGTY